MVIPVIIWRTPPMINQVQYNIYSETANANYSSSSTSSPDSFIEILRNSTIIIETNEVIEDIIPVIPAESNNGLGL